MNLFDLFGKKDHDAPESIFTDKTYMNTTGKLNACIALAKEQPNTIFICWFNGTLKKFRDAFAQQGLDELKVIDAKTFHSAMLQDKIAVFAEHYPLHEKEVALVEHWPIKKILVYSAMDEALFKHLGSDKMLPLMKLLGMKEDEAIEHPLVTKSIIKGQAKIASLVTFEQSANSQEEWLERNLKPST
ncbi:MAG: hypothetical protein WDM90_02795 [Ferruginibacter sp.]